MTDNEIIKALRCCSAPFNDCAGCPLYGDYPSCECERYTIDLINRQKAEIERLKNENMAKEAEYNDMLEQRNSVERYLETAKSEAVKEFASRLKETGVIRCSDVDKLVKEMVGEK